MIKGKRRSFDETTALNAAMNVFWQKGYVGASLTDLTKEMGINKPSMYSAFGNKEALFVKATQCYIDTKMKPHMALLFAPDIPLKNRLKNHMMSIVTMQCSDEQAKGCYLVLCQSELVSGDIPEQAKLILKDAEVIPKQLYVDFFNQDLEAIALGLNKNADANSLSVYTLLKGTASMARSGVAKSQLEYTVDSMLKGIGVN
ncbi:MULTISPECIES: TetR/AcrR family transcriptional regulator [unclassified Colwellia]|uniref:TetR/AcrR family transcriptional regulator n=1 Tax=unclassified Colwellia TaxID=196834 RepID=UPI0015F72437|nr:MULTISPECIES: TetR/AcrR family transcriptional regulator [unclassified Colwellia]MBA6353631.1 TetR/AcrR family transcriptional regulator [Colwellia sp. BRX9-1]MBA6356419.1 TetR/AcrR family transcriptional regulator [Colwellia sp. BRX8-3]MBA6360164.1 TetR/AcrR family transcriptional regulator [Colwellia sp. BRX8-6]MBA6368568.1 TetR/AcrR family transcriptional regulator [Colwellia sp. BRX8-5]MBA6375940.1 TetR/AcrR family transcriptional regulator [Colwellia sp. BRX8-2]